MASRIGEMLSETRATDLARAVERLAAQVRAGGEVTRGDCDDLASLQTLVRRRLSWSGHDLDLVRLDRALGVLASAAADRPPTTPQPARLETTRLLRQVRRMSGRMRLALAGSAVLTALAATPATAGCITSGGNLTCTGNTGPVIVPTFSICSTSTSPVSKSAVLQPLSSAPRRSYLACS